MEKVKKLIMIGGIPSAGKTTLAWRLKEFFGVEQGLCTDLVYFKIGKELGMKQDFASPRTWPEVKPELVGDLKKKYYKKMLPRDEVVLVEGYGLMFEEDRKIIKEILDDYKIIFFYKDISFEDWLKQKRVVDCESRRDEFNYLKKLGTLEEEFLTIK